MSFVVAIFGLFMAALGAAGLWSPEYLLDLVTRAQSRMGLYIIAGIRLGLGCALLLAAPSSRAPHYLQILGCVSLFSGAITPFFSVRRFEAIITWWRRQAPWTVRLWSLLVILLGLSLIWAVVPLEPAA